MANKSMDTLLEGVSEFFEKLPKEDKVIFLTSRTHHELKNLKSFLDKINLRYDKILTDMPMGERILINDNKPSGLKCAYAVNKVRDDALCINYYIDRTL